MVLLCIVAGAFFRRSRCLTPEADASLFNLVVRLFWPCLVVDKVLGNEAVRAPGNLLWSTIFGFATVAAGIALARGLAPGTDGRTGRTFAVTTGIYNYGFIPLPLIMVLFDDRVVATLFVHNLGVELALWTVGVALLSGGLGLRGLARAVNPPSVAVVGASVFTLTGWDRAVPGVALDAAAFLGASCVPMALLLTGATMYDEYEAGPRGRPGRADWAIGLRACVLRLALIPLLMLTAARLLPLPDALLRVVAVTASMGSGLFPLVLSRHYGGDPAVAFRVIFATTVASFLTCPFWIRFGFWWLGLEGQ